MIPIAFDYRRASSIEDALALLAARRARKIIAGGHSLVPLMKMRLSEPSVLIDIARIPGLSGIREAGGGIEIGACTTHYAVASTAPLVDDGVRCWPRRPAPSAIRRCAIAGPWAGAWRTPIRRRTIRRRCSPSTRPCSCRGRTARGVVPAKDFFQGVFTVDLAADEIIVGVRFTPVRTAAYARLRQRASHFAIVGVAAALDVAGGAIRGRTRRHHRRRAVRDAPDRGGKALTGKPANGGHRGRRGGAARRSTR